VRPAIVAVALLASACASGSGGEGSDIQLTLRDFEINLSETTAPAGEVIFSATNEGPSIHEFEIFSVPSGVDPNDLPVEDNVADTEGLELIDEVEDIAPSTTASLSVSLEPGTYALICNLAGHYEQGMHTAFTVE
jgi:uncharacterized cupredoxin-like copper-binding protein